MPRKEFEPRRRKKHLIIDLSEASERAEQARLIIDFVKSLPAYKKGLNEGRFQKGLLFRCFNGENIDKVLKEGDDTDRGYIYCSDEKQLYDEHIDSALDYIYFPNGKLYPIAAISVYDADGFHLEDWKPEAYFFNQDVEPTDTLLLVAELSFD